MIYNDLPYRVGALMYTPALNAGIADKIDKIAGLSSIVLCLEDSIQDSGVKEAEKQLFVTLEQFRAKSARLPLVFVRPRNEYQFERLLERFDEFSDIITGFAFAKFSVHNGLKYAELACGLRKPFMPIFETEDIIDTFSRRHVLKKIYDLLYRFSDSVINIRVGGADFCGIYGLRRGAAHTLYDIGLLKEVVVDILNVFSKKYVVSSPVSEYFSGDKWRDTFRRELQLDILNGFIGKTAIHPAQLPLIRQSLCVSAVDLADENNILGENSGNFAVCKSAGGDRMNELPVHYNWAKKIVTLSKIYGVSSENTEELL